MPQKKITSPLFKGSDSLSLGQWRELEVVSSADGPRRLMDSWGGTVTGFTCARLDNENKIANLNFHLIGVLFADSEGVSADCNKFWDVEEGHTFQLDSFDAKVFQFKSGTLTSDLLDSSELKVSWFKDDAPWPEQERSQAGISGFSLRFFVQPIQPNWASINLQLLPLPKATLLQSYPVCLNPSFPGITLYSAKFCSLGFATERIFKDKNFGTPLLPCVIPGADWEDFPNHPTTASLRTALATTLRAAWKPVGKANAKALKKRWEEIALAGESSLKAEVPAFIWPEPEPSPAAAPEGTVFKSPPPPPFSYFSCPPPSPGF